MIQSAKRKFILNEDRPRNNRIKFPWSYVIEDAEDGIGQCYQIFLNAASENNNYRVLASFFSGNGHERCKLRSALSSPTPEDIRIGSPAIIEELTCPNLRFWPLKQVGFYTTFIAVSSMMTNLKAEVGKYN